MNKRIGGKKDLESVRKEIFNILENREKVSDEKLKEIIFYWLPIEYLYDIMRADLEIFNHIKILKNFQDYINKSI